MSSSEPALGQPLSKSLAAAAEVIGRVTGGASLSATLDQEKRRWSDSSLVAAVQDLCYGTLREYGRVDVILGKLLERPLTDPVLRGLLLAALAELAARPGSAYAVVHQSVEAAKILGLHRARGLVNAVLRGYQRREASLLAQIEATETGKYRHPQWWIDAIRSAYPECWKQLLLESNRHPPMTLRVNRRRLAPVEYQKKLAAAGMAARLLAGEAITLDTPCRVERLPGFLEGEVSVQDAGAQRAAHLLEVKPGMRVLDACAAPGGKTAHILELSDCELLAVDSDPARARRIEETLSRLRLTGTVQVADSREPGRFAPAKTFERILLDVPCSASGVGRRHPDIRWLRRAGDIAGFVRAQRELLEALWPALTSGGRLLYATCSVFPEENQAQVSEFLLRHADATLAAFPAGFDGRILPGPDSDGFFYAALVKA